MKPVYCCNATQTARFNTAIPEVKHFCSPFSRSRSKFANHTYSVKSMETFLYGCGVSILHWHALERQLALCYWISLLIFSMKYEINESPYRNCSAKQDNLNRLFLLSVGRCVLLENFLVYPSATDKQTIHVIQGVIVQAACHGPSPYKASVASPHPQTGHRWNAAPGILPQLAGCRAAAAWNMIRPLSKHALHCGCVQGQRKHLKLGKVLLWPTQLLCAQLNSDDWRWFITCDYDNLRIPYSLSLVIINNLSSLSCHSLGSQCSLLS